MAEDDYITLAELKKRLQGKIAAEYEADASIMISAVSRGADNYLEVPTGFFIPPTVATSRVLYGTGSAVIELPVPIQPGDVTITPPTGLTAPNFTVYEGNLVTLTDEGNRDPLLYWAKGRPYTVTALWGWEAIPPELKEALLQWATRFWRGRDEAFSGVIGGIRTDGSIIERSMPAPARALLDGLKSRVRRVSADVKRRAYIA